MIILFSDFYYKNYVKAEKKLKKQPVNSIKNDKKQEVDDKKEI